MKLVVGLGNPGSRYQGTRHNVGFEVVDQLAAGPGAGSFQTKFKGQMAELREDTHKVLLVEPDTFMNLSGQCVRQFVDFYQVPVEDILVICDDINLPLGKLRIRTKGSHGGHNGLRDIQAHLGTTEYARLRIGVGSPEEDLVDYVLGRFRPSEKPVIQEAISRASQAVVTWIHQGAEVCMNQYNSDS